jgi:hypothetical protein
MGLLKHAILPVFALMHFSVCVVLWTGGPMAVVKMFDWPPKENDEELTLWEEHAIGIIGALELTMTFGCVVGVVMENSHFRGVMVVMELICWGLGGYDAYRLGVPSAFAFSMAGLALIGLVVHSREPGLFTKDKSKEQKSK